MLILLLLNILLLLLILILVVIDGCFAEMIWFNLVPFASKARADTDECVILTGTLVAVVVLVEAKLNLKNKFLRRKKN